MSAILALSLSSLSLFHFDRFVSELNAAYIHETTQITYFMSLPTSFWLKNKMWRFLIWLEAKRILEIIKLYNLNFIKPL